MTNSKDYWGKYYNFWDEFVGRWLAERKAEAPLDEVSLAYQQACDELDFDILPTPYLGRPSEGVDAVFLNMNPGLSEIGKRGEYRGVPLDDTQRFSLLRKPNGWLIKAFMCESEGSYRRFVDKWSCLNPDLRDYDPQVCGVDWWQGLNPGKVGGRAAWLRRIYNNCDMSPSRVFAVELCPYHSKKWNAAHLDECLLPFICEHVIDPACVAVHQNRLPFAVAIGKVFVDLFVSLGANMEHEWSYKDPMLGWPQNSKGNPTVRVYRMYAIQRRDGQTTRFLVTWAQANSNPPPSPHFGAIERNIRLFAGVKG